MTGFTSEDHQTNSLSYAGNAFSQVFSKQFNPTAAAVANEWHTLFRGGGYPQADAIFDAGTALQFQSVCDQLAGAGSLYHGGNADLYAIGWMVATDDVSEALTVNGIVSGVWKALAADHNDAGTLGAKLNMASAGGVDTGALVNAIVAALQTAVIPVDVKAINGAELSGSGVTGDEWGPA